MTGAELRAWRERLGKDEAWALSVLRVVRGRGLADCPGEATVTGRLRVAEDDFAYTGHDRATLRTAYAAALEAEERAQSARPVEPVCPEGVQAIDKGTFTRVHSATDMRGWDIAHVYRDGSVCLLGTRQPAEYAAPIEHIEYVVALSRFRAAHAASDKQRKLDAVRAAEEAYGKASQALAEAIAHKATADMAEQEAARAMMAARREAGL